MKAAHLPPSTIPHARRAQGRRSVPSVTDVSPARGARTLACSALLALSLSACGGSGNSTPGTGGAPATGGAPGTSTGGQGPGGGAGGAATGGAAAGGMNGAGGLSGTGGLSGSGGATASGSTFYVSPDGAGTSCTTTAPCAITQAQAVVRSAATSMSSDLVVVLSDGTYRLTAPLVFTAADSGSNGHTITGKLPRGLTPCSRAADQSRAGASPIPPRTSGRHRRPPPSRLASSTSTARSPRAHAPHRSADRT